MPPQAMMPSDFSIRFSITRILSEILAPPTMARRGRSTFSGSMTWRKGEREAGNFQQASSRLI